VDRNSSLPITHRQRYHRSDIKGGAVEQILIRNLPEGTKAILRRRAAAHNSSIEAEAREALAVGIAAEEPTLVDLISMSTDAHVEFEPKRLGLKARSAEL